MYGCSLGMLDKVGIGTPIPTLFLYFFTWPSLHFDSFVEAVKGETKGDIRTIHGTNCGLRISYLSV